MDQELQFNENMSKVVQASKPDDSGNPTTPKPDNANTGNPENQDFPEIDTKSMTLEQLAIYTEHKVLIHETINQANELEAKEPKEIEDYQTLEKLYERLERIFKSESQIIEANTPEGEPISFDMHQVREDSIKLFESLGLSELANSFPEKIYLSEEQIERVQALAKTEGFNRFLLVPGNINNASNIEKLKIQSEQYMQGLPSDQQYSMKGSWLSDTVQLNFPHNIETLNRDEGKAYLLFLKDSPYVPENTFGKFANIISAEFAEKKLHGLTLSEFFIFQRDYTQRHLNDEIAHLDNNRGEWILDSRITFQDVHHNYDKWVLYAGWVASEHHFELDLDDPELEISSGHGARPSAIFPL